MANTQATAAEFHDRKYFNEQMLVYVIRMD